MQTAFSSDSEMTAQFGDYIVIPVADYYDGEYTVVPQPYEAVVLPTISKVMRDDVIVAEIPYYTTTNEKGGYTAIIGG
jgi:hypothetical protein